MMRFATCQCCRIVFVNFKYCTNCFKQAIQLLNLESRFYNGQGNRCFHNILKTVCVCELRECNWKEVKLHSSKLIQTLHSIWGRFDGDLFP